MDITGEKISGVSSPGRYTKPHFRVKEYIIAIKSGEKRRNGYKTKGGKK